MGRAALPVTVLLPNPLIFNRMGAINENARVLRLVGPRRA
jgi:hypothetical protein